MRPATRCLRVATCRSRPLRRSTSPASRATRVRVTTRSPRGPGTPGSSAISSSTSTLPTPAEAAAAHASLEPGALSSGAALAGKVATRDIYPGDQITAADFAADADPLRGELTGDQRAMAVPLDSAHGLIGQVRAGDKVDVLAGFNAASSAGGAGRPQLRTLIQNVLVLKAPDGAKTASSTSTQNLTVRVTAAQAAQVAFAADN